MRSEEEILEWINIEDSKLRRVGELILEDGETPDLDDVAYQLGYLDAISDLKKFLITNPL